MECDSLCPFGADAGKLPELVDEVLDDSFVHLSPRRERVCRRVAPSPGLVARPIPVPRALAQATGLARLACPAFQAARVCRGRRPLRRDLRAAEAAGQRAHRLRLNGFQSAVRVAAGGEDQVGERGRGLRGIARIDRLLGDGHVDQLALTADRDLDQPAARAALDLRLGQPLLRVHELALHLRRGGEELLHVQLPAGFHAVHLLSRMARRRPSRAGGGTGRRSRRRTAT